MRIHGKLSRDIFLQLWNYMTNQETVYLPPADLGFIDLRKAKRMTGRRRFRMVSFMKLKKQEIQCRPISYGLYLNLHLKRKSHLFTYSVFCCGILLLGVTTWILLIYKFFVVPSHSFYLTFYGARGESFSEGCKSPSENALAHFSLNARYFLLHFMTSSLYFRTSSLHDFTLLLHHFITSRHVEVDKEKVKYRKKKWSNHQWMSVN